MVVSEDSVSIKTSAEMGNRVNKILVFFLIAIGDCIVEVWSQRERDRERGV